MNSVTLDAQCVGNLIVDLPAQPKISWTQKIDDAEVSRMVGTASIEQFWKSVEDRRKQLLSLPHETEKTQLGLFETFEKRAAIALYRDSDVWTGGYKMDRFLWLNTRGYLLQSEAASNGIKDQIPRLTAVFSAIDERDGAPAEKGFCIDGAVMRGQQAFLEANASQEDLGAIGFENASLTVSQRLSQLPLPETAEPPITAFEALKREEESTQISREKLREGAPSPTSPRASRFCANANVASGVLRGRRQLSRRCSTTARAATSSDGQNSTPPAWPPGMTVPSC